MQSKGFFSKLRRREEEALDAPDHAKSPEVPMNNLDVNTHAGAAEPQGVLLSCEDIYHASGILRPHSKYSITKIVEMLDSVHIRELPRDVKRASVLMALDAADTQVDEVLQDATRRQHSLDAYEASQRKQFEEFEAGKIRENAHIQAELERVTAHYSDRIQHNQAQVGREKDALGIWQTMKDRENQRISEAVALCGKQPGAEPSSDALAIPSRRRAAAAAL